MNRLAILPVALGLALTSACSLLAPAPEQQIIGAWQAEVGGYPVTVSYTETTVQVGTADPVGYSLEGDKLLLAAGDTQVRIVSFPSRGEMLQTDPLTGTSQVWKRVQ